MIKQGTRGTIKSVLGIATAVLLMAASSTAFAQAPADNGMFPPQATPDASSLLGPAGDLPVDPNNPAGASYAGGVPIPMEQTQAELAADAAEQKQKLRDAAFDQALEALLPLKPEEIREMLDTFKNSREAAETPIVFPEPKIHVQTVMLDPGENPPIVQLMPGHVTTVTILDITGEPWPIQDVSFAGRFEITPPESGGHVIRVVPLTAHGIGNMSIRLVDLITPVTFSLRVGLGELHYRFDARIPKYGPLAKAPLIEHGGLSAVAGNETLMQVLDGVPPKEAETLTVRGADDRTSAWKISGRVYVRTSLTLLSPTWESSVRSADGMNVYSLGDAPILLLSDNGKMVRAEVVAEVIDGK